MPTRTRYLISRDFDGDGLAQRKKWYTGEDKPQERFAQDIRRAHPFVLRATAENRMRTMQTPGFYTVTAYMLNHISHPAPDALEDPE